MAREVGDLVGISLASGTSITERKINLHRDGTLVGLSINLANTGTGPIKCAASYIPRQGGPAIRLLSKYIRASLSGEDDGASWHGEFPLTGDNLSYISVNLRNDTGSAVTVNVNWIARVEE